MGIGAGECKCQKILQLWQRLEEVVRSPAARVTGGCEMTNMDIGSQTQTLCMSSVCS